MSQEIFLGGKVQLCCGESLHFLRDQPDNRYDSIVADPPYALVSIVKRFANSPRSERTENQENPYGRTGRGFMGQRWDTGETAFAVAFWTECLRVLKPGGHVVAFGGTRTYHRLACAIEDSGFEIRDQLAWCYGSGFPKSHNAGNGWGTALKPAWEPICLARKPLIGTVAANVLEHGTGAINIDGCRVPSDGGAYSRDGEASQDRRYTERGSTSFSLKPGPRGGDPSGRWPANILHDGSDDVLAVFPDAPGQQGDLNETGRSRPTKHAFGDMAPPLAHAARGDSGSAARFFYTAKADADDRLGSKHPTVKPLDLMQWLVRLVTPKDGLVLDPFAGTGTTGEAAFREGMRCVLIEREVEYQEDIRRRMRLALGGTGERRRESIKAKNLPVDDGPLFSTSS